MSSSSIFVRGREQDESWGPFRTSRRAAGSTTSRAPVSNVLDPIRSTRTRLPGIQKAPTSTARRTACTLPALTNRNENAVANGALSVSTVTFAKRLSRRDQLTKRPSRPGPSTPAVDSPVDNFRALYERLYEHFRSYDPGEFGFLRPTQLKDALGALTGRLQLSPDTMRNVVRSCDLHGTGHINYHHAAQCVALFLMERCPIADVPVKPI